MILNNSCDKTNVLFIISTPIDIQVINSSPRFIKYNFSSFDIIKYLHKGNYKEEEKIFFNLDTRIQVFKPEILIIHIGLAFIRFPLTVINLILIIRDRFPEIKVGLDKKKEYILQYVYDMPNSQIKSLKRLEDFKNCTFYDDDLDVILLRNIFK